MRYKKWMISFLMIFLAGLLLLSSMVIILDPYFHYHKPLEGFYYELNDQRYQNNGITKHFDYEGILTGTSMTENFKTSDAERIFGEKFIKVPFSGAMFKEIDDNIRVGLESHEVKRVIRSIDSYKINADKNESAYDQQLLPVYLYDKNPFNDVNYLLNPDVLTVRCIPMLKKRLAGKPGGMTSFDQYGNWNADAQFGLHAVIASAELPEEKADVQNQLTDEDVHRIQENIRENVTQSAEEYPNTQFYCFFPPYSVAYWGILQSRGELLREVNAMELAAGEMVKHPNIKVFCFGDVRALVENYDLYKDDHHYHEDVNTWLLQQMHEGNGILTEKNYQSYFENLYEYYSEYDYGFLYEK